MATQADASEAIPRPNADTILSEHDAEGVELDAQPIGATSRLRLLSLLHVYDLTADPVCFIHCHRDLRHHLHQISDPSHQFGA